MAMVKLHLQEPLHLKARWKNICSWLLNYLQFFLFNDENKLMLIKRWGFIIRQNHGDVTLAESQTNRLIFFFTKHRFFIAYKS